MLIFLTQKLAFLAVPKTGTTAFEREMKSRADFVRITRRKHTHAARFSKHYAPILRKRFGKDVETLAVMRDPVDQIRSWYRYRSRSEAKGGPMSTQGCSFDDFVRAVIADAPPPFAQIGSQHAFLTDGQGRLLVDHLFAWERGLKLRDFIAARFGEDVRFKRKNVSPDTPAPISTEVAQALRAARPEEFALHAQLMAAGGYLHTPQR